MASFQAKMGRDMPKNREKKNFIPIRSYLTRVRKYKKKKSKNLKTSSWLHFKPKRDGIGWKIEKKDISFQSVPTWTELENSNNIILASFHAETGWDRPKNREKKICSDPFLPDPSKEINKKNSKKIQKIKKYRPSSI